MFSESNGADTPGNEAPQRGKKVMNLETIGGLVLLVGLGITVLGGILLFISRVPGLNQLGNLPGDIHIETGNLSCFVPIVSMIIISVVLTIIANVVIRLINRP